MATSYRVIHTLKSRFAIHLVLCAKLVLRVVDFVDTAMLCLADPAPSLVFILLEIRCPFT